MNNTPLTEILKEFTPNMSTSLRSKYKTNVLNDNKSQNAQLIYDLLNEIEALREHNKYQKVTIMRQKNEIYQYTRYGLNDLSFQSKNK